MTGSTPEDDKAFKKLLADDPECKKCFECDYPYPQWCSYTHGIMMCLDCSGKHRGLGTHLVTVRSSTMDGWSNWKPEKLKQMVLGGNKKCRLFFEQHGISKLPLKEKYGHPKAQMYRARLEAQGLGQSFDEASFRAQDFSPRPEQQQQRGGGGGDRFKGVGSSGGNQQPAQESEWMSTLSSGWNSVATGATNMASSASKSVASADLGTKVSATASETATNVSAGATKAWGAMAYFATSLASNVKGSLGDGGDSGDGLGGLTRSVERTSVSGEESSKFGHVEHVAERTNSNESADCDGLRGLTSGLQRPQATKCQYESFGSDSAPARGSNRATPSNSNEDFMSALSEPKQKQASPPPATQKVSTPSSRSPPQASPASFTPQASPTAQKVSPKPVAKKAAEDDEWNTDW